MKKTLFAVLGLCLMFGCDNSTDVLNCDKYTVEILPNDSSDVIDIVINGDRMQLGHVVSASGARYIGNLNDTAVEMWNKGRTWTLTIGEDETFSCK